MPAVWTCPLSENGVQFFKALEKSASLEIAVKQKNDSIAEKITHAGSVFLGAFSCESAGDYASGTNHTLPTKGYAKAYSGLCLDSFMRKITFQRLSSDGVKSIGKAVELMAEAEGLDAHKNAMTVRLNYVNGLTE